VKTATAGLRIAKALEPVPGFRQFGRDARAAWTHLGAYVVRDQANDALAIGRRQSFTRIEESLGQAVDLEPPIGVEHHLDDRGIFQKLGDRRPEGRAQHARAAKDRLRFLVSGRHVVPVLVRACEVRPWIGDE
jgi:hypothetical protein